MDGKMIDLFQLHESAEDKGAYSWIVIDGAGILSNFEILIDKITEKSNCSVKELSRQTSRRIGCSDCMLYDILNGRTEWISLALIDELLRVLEKLDAKKEVIEMKKSFLSSVELLKSTPRSTVKIKAAKKLLPELAEFCGIHAADGSLKLEVKIETKNKKDVADLRKELNNRFSDLSFSKRKRRGKHELSFYITRSRGKILKYLNSHDVNFSTFYRVQFAELDKSSMKHLKELVSKLFGYQIKIKPLKRTRGYYAAFSNKIIGRYLNNIFDFPVGKKSDKVDAPKLVKESSSTIQKAFVKGVMQFDGSVKRNGNVAISTNSQNLLDFLLKTIEKDGLEGAVWTRKDNKKELGFESPPSKQWLTYFVKGTPKYQRLYEYIYGFEEKVSSREEAVKILDKAFPPSSRSTLNFTELIEKASELKEFTNYQISEQLDVNYRTLLFMLKILERAKVIEINRVEMLERIDGERDRITFNSDVNKWRVPRVYE